MSVNRSREASSLARKLPQTNIPYPMHNSKSFRPSCFNGSYSSPFSSQPSLDSLINRVIKGVERFFSWIFSCLPSSWTNSLSITERFQIKTNGYIDGNNKPPLFFDEDKAATLKEVREGKNPLGALLTLLEKVVSVPTGFNSIDVDEVVQAFIDNQRELFEGIAYYIFICSGQEKRGDQTDIVFARGYLDSKAPLDRWKTFLEGIRSSRLAPLNVFLLNKGNLIVDKCKSLQDEFFTSDFFEPTFCARVKRNLRDTVLRMSSEESMRPFLNRIADWMDKLDTSRHRECLHFLNRGHAPWEALVAYVQIKEFDLVLMRDALRQLFFEEIFCVFNDNEADLATKLYYLQIGIQGAHQSFVSEVFRRFRFEGEGAVSQNADIYQELVIAVFRQDAQSTAQERYFRTSPRKLSLQEAHFQNALEVLKGESASKYGEFVKLIVRSLPFVSEEVTRKREDARLEWERERAYLEAETLRLNRERLAAIEIQRIEEERVIHRKEFLKSKFADLFLLSDKEVEDRPKIEALQRILQKHTDDPEYVQDALRAFKTYNPRLFNILICSVVEASGDFDSAISYSELEKLSKKDKCYGHPFHLPQVFSMERWSLRRDYYSMFFIPFAVNTDWDDKVEEAMQAYLKAQFDAGTLDYKYLLAGIQEYL